MLDVLQGEWVNGFDDLIDFIYGTEVLYERKAGREVSSLRMLDSKSRGQVSFQKVQAIAKCAVDVLANKLPRTLFHGFIPLCIVCDASVIRGDGLVGLVG